MKVPAIPCLLAVPFAFFALDPALPDFSWAAIPLTHSGDLELGIYPSSAVAADFNRDNVLDLAVAGSDFNGLIGTVSVLLGNGDGTFRPRTDFGSGGDGATSVATGDVNLDGTLDL